MTVSDRKYKQFEIQTFADMVLSQTENLMHSCSENFKVLGKYNRIELQS